MNSFNISSHKIKYRIRFLTGFTLLSCLITSPGYAAAEKLIILYTGSTLGEVKPCGCSEEGDLGGILRRATIIEKERFSNENVLVLDAGDSFKEPTDQGKLKAKAIIQAMGIMGYDATLPGEKDFIYGEKIINQSSFNRWVFSNIEHKNINRGNTLKYYLKELTGGTKIVVIGLLGPELVYSKGQTSLKVKNPVSELKQLLLKLNSEENIDVVILLVHMAKETAEELFSLKGVDIVINGHLNEEERVIDPEISENRVMVHVRERGQYLGKITAVINNRRIQSISNEYIPLTEKVNDSPLVQELYDNYNEEAKQLFFKWLKDKKKIKNSAFVTDNACKECHSEAYAIWEKSKHAGAFHSLKKANKTFDSECLLCHTTGFKQDGGFLVENLTANLANVQCEVCHGAGREHVFDQESPYNKASKKVCVNCHTRENSPAFNFLKYWPKIQH